MSTQSVDIHNQHRLTFIAVSIWFVAAVFYALDYLQHTIPSVLIAPIANSIGTSYIDIATIMSIYFPVYALSQIPAGYLIDRYGLKMTMTYACLLLSLALLLLLIPTKTAVFSSRLLIAIGSAFAIIGTYKSVSVYLPKRYFTVFIGITQSIGTIGGLTGQVFINYLIEQYGWHYSIIGIALFGIFWSIVMLCCLKNQRSENHADANHAASHLAQPSSCLKSGSLSEIFRDKNIWLLAIYAAIMVGAVMNTFAELYDVLFLQKSFNISSQQATYITMFIFIGVGVGAPLHGLIANLFQRPRLWSSICALLTFINFSLITLSALWPFNRFILMGLYFSLGFFVCSMLLSFSIARCCYPIHRHAVIFAFVNSIIGVAGFFFPVVFGVLVHFALRYAHPANELVFPLILLSGSLMISFILTFFINDFRLQSPAAKC